MHLEKGTNHVTSRYVACSQTGVVLMDSWDDFDEFRPLICPYRTNGSKITNLKEIANGRRVLLVKKTLNGYNSGDIGQIMTNEGSKHI